MRGKTIVITGATSGIGRAAATALAGMGTRLVLGARTVERGEEAARAIRQAHPDAEVVVHAVDLGVQASVRAWAARLLASEPRIDVLINNAAVNTAVRRVSPDGVELVFATNVVAYYLLATLLLDRLRASAPARIVNVASSFAGDLDLDDLQMSRRRLTSTNAYRQSKACDRLLTWALARRLEGSGVTASAMTPGVVWTGLYREAGLGARMLMRTLASIIGKSPEGGADTLVWLATSDEVAGVTGKFYERRRERRCELRDPSIEEELWRRLEALTAGE